MYSTFDLGKHNRKIIREDVDLKGLVSRGRVLNQSVFDVLLLKKDISVAQYCAAQEFTRDLGLAGCSVQSPSMEPFPYSGEPHKSGDRRAERIMILSAPLGALRDLDNNHAETCLFGCVTGVLKELSKANLKSLQKALDALSRHYGTQGLPDPRDLVHARRERQRAS